MPEVGSESNPLRVAIIGSGPAGFYTVSNFLKYPDVHVEIDMYDRLPTPFGLVRGGVAPDHQKDKSVTRAYDKSAQQPNFRFYGNVEFSNHISLDDLKQYYHQVIFTVGAQVDRNLDIPGEDLAGSHSATEFVAWYNGHPDFADRKFDLSAEGVAIIGVGNVAVDVARILCKTPRELHETDMAGYAIEALSRSSVKRVYMLGRRGPAQAAFTPPEIKELGELEGADITVPRSEAVLDAETRAEVEASGDKNVIKNVEMVEAYADSPGTGKGKRLTLRFLVSPTEIIGDDNGHVKAIRIVKNELYRDERGSVRPRATGEEEVIPVGLVFRSVGYRGVPLAGVPFNERNGVIPNHEGRVTDESGHVVLGLYVAGWIKRGPSGVIGTNKTDAQETVACMVEDMKAGKHLAPSNTSVDAARALVAGRQPAYVSYQDWSRIDAEELANGEAEGRPRVKFTKVVDMLTVVGKSGG